jgi:hypothetical protein
MNLAQQLPVKIIIGGKMLEVLYSHMIITVAPHFSLSTYTANPTRFIPVVARSLSLNG